MKVATAGALAGLLLGCGPLGRAGTGEDPTRTPEPASPASSPASASASASAMASREGEVLELTVPLLGGGRLELAELRGHPVLLELADARTPDREQTQDRYRALVERHDEVMVVTVALDPTVDDLPAGWQDAPPFVLGWDPQGALAARLGLVTLPTVVLLDPQGCIVSVSEGQPPDEATLSSWLGSGNGTKGACVAAAP